MFGPLLPWQNLKREYFFPEYLKGAPEAPQALCEYSLPKQFKGAPQAEYDWTRWKDLALYEYSLPEQLKDYWLAPQAVFIFKASKGLALCHYSLPERLKGQVQAGQDFLRGFPAIPDTGFWDWDTLQTGFRGLQLLKSPSLPPLEAVLKGRPTAHWGGFHRKFYGLDTRKPPSFEAQETFTEPESRHATTAPKGDFWWLQLLKSPSLPPLEAVLKGRPTAHWGGFHRKFYGLDTLGDLLDFTWILGRHGQPWAGACTRKYGRDGNESRILQQVSHRDCNGYRLRNSELWGNWINTDGISRTIFLKFREWASRRIE